MQPDATVAAPAPSRPKGGRRAWPTAEKVALFEQAVANIRNGANERILSSDPKYASEAYVGWFREQVKAKVSACWRRQADQV